MILALIQVAPPQTIVVQGHRPAHEATVGKVAMKYLPFQVPKGVTSIEIVPEIRDREGDRDTVDLRLFAPGGLGERQFRGWQGGTRRPAVITGSFETTSPWAIAGPLPAGTWHLAQYYLKASSKGLDYRYTITFHFDGPKPPSRVPPVPVPKFVQQATAPGGYIGALHAHSLSSDGALTLTELARRHRQAGFNFLASTEHNTPAAHWRIAETMREVPGLTIIPGTELTTPGGHANLIGLRPERWIDFRVEPGDGGLVRRFSDARRQGALIFVNHPFAECTSCPWTFRPEEWRDAHGIEVWNSYWDPTDEKALALWDSLLRQGRRIFAYGGSDFHRDPAPLGPVVRVWAKSPRSEDLVPALKSGNFVLHRSPEDPDLRFGVSQGKQWAGPGKSVAGTGPITVQMFFGSKEEATLTVHSRRGIEGSPITVGPARFREKIELPEAPYGYLRLELRSKSGAMLALTNPVFL